MELVRWGAELDIPENWLQSWQPAVVWLAEANTAQTRRAYTATMRAFMGVVRVELRDVREVHVAAFKVHLVDRGLAPATVRQRLIILRIFFAWAVARGHHTGPNPADGIPLPGRQRVSSGIALSAEQLGVLLDACGNARDRAMIAVLAGSGLRARELAGLRQRDYTTDAGQRILVVHYGKGGMTRKVSVPKWVQAMLDAYLGAGERPARAAAPLFRRLTCPPAPAGRCGGQEGGISYYTVYRVVVETAQEVGLPAISPHDLRRTYATAALDAGVPVLTLQREMGHTDIRQTLAYHVPGREGGETSRVADFMDLQDTRRD